MKKADSLTSSLTSSLTGSDNRAAVKPKRADAAERTSGGQLGNGDYVDAINQLFAELELAYHNQFHKAYAQEGSVNVAKKYWLECLGIFTPDIILKAVRNVVRTQQYLPTIASMVEACEDMMSERGCLQPMMPMWKSVVPNTPRLNRPGRIRQCIWRERVRAGLSWQTRVRTGSFPCLKNNTGVTAREHWPEKFWKSRFPRPCRRKVQGSCLLRKIKSGWRL